MSENLYPLKFKPQYKDRIWGGTGLKKFLKKDVPAEINSCGESWEISAVQDSVSVVANGFLSGNTLEELIEVYMGDIVGDEVYEKFGVEFPLLIKFIDAQDILSIQVHPDDDTAKKLHHAYGKTEMWYIIQADKDSEIIVGFNQNLTREQYLQALSNGSLKDFLNVEKTVSGDVFFIPAGRVHAIGKGILLVEIQQTSDITYRIYDWDRVDANGKSRDLHNDLALNVIDLNAVTEPKWTRINQNNKTAELASCKYFTVNRLSFAESIKRDYNVLDSFVIYICLEGELSIIYGQGESEKISLGETILVPAALKDIILRPAFKSTILEIYIK